MIKRGKFFVSRYATFAKVFTGVGTAQAFLQGINLLTGLIIIRWLNPTEYAYYTIAGGVMSFLAIVTDSGMSSAAYTVAGRIWRDPDEMGNLVATFASLRRQFTIVAMMLAGPVMIWLLYRNGANFFTITALLLIGGIQFWIALPAMTSGLAPALHQKVFETQKITITQAVFRIGTTIIGLAVSAKALLAFASTIPAQCYANYKLRRLSESLIHQGKSNPEHRSAMLAIVRKVLPGSLYYALSGQITILLVSIFGSTGTIAQVGALGRLGQLTVVLSSVSSVLLAPRFARIEANAKRVKKIYISIIFLAGACSAVVCFGASLFPHAFLWLLGSHYQGLEQWVWLQFLCASIGLLAGIAYQLGSVRGIIFNPLLAIPIAIIYQALGVMVFDFTSVQGVLLFSSGLNIIQLFQNTVYFVGTSHANECSK